MTEDLETKLEEFEEWLVEERYANKTILNTRQYFINGQFR